MGGGHSKSCSFRTLPFVRLSEKGEVGGGHSKNNRKPFPLKNGCVTIELKWKKLSKNEGVCQYRIEQLIEVYTSTVMGRMEVS